MDSEFDGFYRQADEVPTMIVTGLIRYPPSRCYNASEADAISRSKAIGPGQAPTEDEILVLGITDSSSDENKNSEAKDTYRRVT